MKKTIVFGGQNRFWFKVGGVVYKSQSRKEMKEKWLGLGLKMNEVYLKKSGWVLEKWCGNKKEKLLGFEFVWLFFD